MSAQRVTLAAPGAGGQSNVDVLVPVLGGLLIGVVLVARPPIALAIALATLGLVGILILGTWRSVNPITLVVPAVIVGGMKFRYRLATESLQGSVDANILFELGMYGAILALTALVVLSRGVSLWRPTTAELWLFAYASWTVLSTAWSVSPTFTAVRGMQVCVLLLAVTALVRAVPLERLLTRAALAYVLIISVTATLALVFPWARGIRFDWFTGSPRFAWFADHPIQVAVHGGLAAVLVMALIMERPSRVQRSGQRTWLLWAGLVIALGVMVATVSRGPVVAILATAAAMMAVRYLNVRQASAAVFCLLALVLAATLFASPIQALATLEVEPGGLMQMLLRERSGANLLSLGGRMDLWTGAAGLASDRPLLGYGFVASRGPMLEQLASEYDGLWIGTRPGGRPQQGQKVIVTLEATAATQQEAEGVVDRAVLRLLALASGSR